MREEILIILKEIRGDIDFSKETKLLSDEIFDSFDIIALLASISEKLNIEIDVDDITEENFNSYESICKYLERNGGNKK